ncbi:hypothetical protein, partial [[Clostridium] scindens]
SDSQISGSAISSHKNIQYIYENNCELRGLIKDTQIKGIPKGIKRKKANLEEIVFFLFKKGI